LVQKSDKKYTQLVRIEMEGENIAEIEKNKIFLIGLGLENFKSSIPNILSITSAKDSIDPQNPYIVIAPGASSAIRQWPEENYAELIRRIIKSSNSTITLIGNKQEHDVCHSLKQSFPTHITNKANQTSLIELINLIKFSKLFIGNESGPLHISAAVNTPSVCILGGGHYGRFLPYKVDVVTNDQSLPKIVNHKMDCYHCNWHCIHTDDRSKAVPCIKDISIDKVWSIVEKTINDQTVQ